MASVRYLRPGDWVTLIAVVPVYVFLSSWFGLTRDWMLQSGSENGFEAARGFFGSVWQASIEADIIFALGSAGVGFGALLAVAYACRRLPPGYPGLVAGGAAILSVFANWIVYALSFQMMFPSWMNKSDFPGEGVGSSPPFGEAMKFTWEWGWPALILVTGLAPLLYWGIMEAMRAAGAPYRPVAANPGWVEPAASRFPPPQIGPPRMATRPAAPSARPPIARPPPKKP